jgi:putative hydrolase of the HAD superfamily
MPIKCVFFDFDGVLRNWDYEANQLEEEHGIPRGGMWEVAFAPALVEPALRGEITDEEWRDSILVQLLAKFPDADVLGAVDTWESSYGVLVPEVLEITKECKKNVQIALFTNATSSLNHHLELLGIANLFDFVVNASETGFFKPEPEIYHHALEMVGMTVGEVFFTDDRRENIEIAEELGWSGHVFDTASELREALVDAGVL